MIPGADRDSTPWWEAVARHELLQQRCHDCGRWRWPPRAICGECGSFAWSWLPASGEGTVLAWIRTRHGFLPGLEAPYVTVQVALAEQDDITMIGSWESAAEPTIGQRVRAVFVSRSGETTVGWSSA